MIREYFLGRPTGNGFSTHIFELVNSGRYFTYILKGGPGTGKSTLMKRIAYEQAEQEIYRCSSDPDSYDAVVLPRSNVMIIDGTAPHTIDPKYVGIRQKIIDLGDCLNTEKLSLNDKRIILLTDECSAKHINAKCYIRAAQELYRDIESASENCLINDKIYEFCRRHTKSIPKKGSCTKGIIEFKQITSITPKGILTSVSAFSDYKTYKIDDKYFSASDAILKKLAANFAELGYDVTVSENPLFKYCVYQHMIVPELMIAFTASGELEYNEVLSCEEFYRTELLSGKASRMEFDRYAAQTLIGESVSVLAQAKQIHDRLETYYIDAMNFDRAERIAKRIARRLK